MENMKVRNVIIGIVLSVLGVFLWNWQPKYFLYYDVLEIIHLTGAILVAVGLGLLALGIMEVIMYVLKKEKPSKAD